MSWPTDDLDISAPHYTREKTLAAVTKTKAMLATELRDTANEYYYHFSISAVEAEVYTVAKSSTASSWTIEDPYDVDSVQINHGLDVANIDKFAIHVGVSSYADDPPIFYVSAKTANSFTLSLENGAGNTGFWAGWVRVYCRDYNAASVLPADDLTTTALDSGGDSCTAGRAEIHAAAQKLQGILTTPFPQPLAIYTLLVAFGIDFDTQGIIAKSNSAASWTYAYVDTNTFDLVHNLGTGIGDKLTVLTTGGIGLRESPEFNPARTPWVSAPLAAGATPLANSIRVHAKQTNRHTTLTNGIFNIIAYRFPD